MKKNLFKLTALLSVFALFVLAACGSDSSNGNGGSEGEEVEFLSILTGGTTGTYYPLGGMFAQLIEEETGISTTPESSQASAANMTGLKDGKAEIAFVQTDIAYYAVNGELMFKDDKIDMISALGALYPETVQLVTTAKSGIKTFDDLKGKKVSVGAPGSGTYANAEQLLEVHGLSIKDDIEAQNLDFGESQESLQSGQIDAAFITAGTPTAAVETLNATTEVVIVPVEDAKADELIEKYPYYAKEVVPKGTYGLTEDVPTVSVGAMLVVKNDLPEEVVYNITKAIYEGAGSLTHPKGKFIKTETGLNGIGIPVHPGAQKFFEENGVKAEQ